MTVLGDPHQTILPTAAGGGIQVLKELFGADETETVSLTRTYRSTEQIVRFTRGMVPGGSGIVPFHRDGPLPTCTQAETLQQLLQELQDRLQRLLSGGARTVAVICRSAAECGEACEGLGAFEGVRQIRSGSSTFEAGVSVLPAYLAKGIEFDAVLIYNASARVYFREEERLLFYTACTRAMHELHLFTLGERSPFLEGVEAGAVEYRTAAP